MFQRSFFAREVRMHNRGRLLVAVAFLLLCSHASATRAQVAGTARLAAFPVASDAGVGGGVRSPASSPIVVSPAAHEDSSGASSNVRKHVVIGAVLGLAVGVALFSFEYQHCADHSAQSDRQACAVIVVVGVPVIGLAGLVGGILGRVTADPPHRVVQ